MDAENDWDVRVFAQIISRLPEHLPISDKMEETDPQKKGRWWSSQRQHLKAWFEAQTTHGEGAYSRQKLNFSARTAYNRFQCAEGLVWLAEAVGVDSSLVEQAAHKSLEIPRRSRCKVVRELIAWDLIAKHVKSLEG